MPSFIRLRCCSCDFELTTEDSRTYLRLDDGRRALLPHPREYDRALALTQKELPVLEAEGRLERVDLYFCRPCGGLREFPRPRVEADPAADAALRSRIADTDCPDCGTRGGWTDLFSIEGERCPRCRQGVLDTDLDFA